MSFLFFVFIDNLFLMKFYLYLRLKHFQCNKYAFAHFDLIKDINCHHNRQLGLLSDQRVHAQVNKIPQAEFLTGENLILSMILMKPMFYIFTHFFISH